MEWADPRYADLMAHLKAVREKRAHRGDERLVRGFVLTAPISQR
jgi:hypothetical protein